MKVFVTRPIPGAGLDALRNARMDVLMREVDSPIPRAEFLASIADCDSAIVMLTEAINEELLAAAPKLRIVANFAVGVNNIDVSAATRRGVAVTNTPDVLTDATADMAWALLLAAARRVGEGERLVRAGQWSGWGPMQLIGAHVTRKTLGIIGPGRIGRAMARRARGFDMQVLYSGRSASPEMERESGAKRVEMGELLAASDFISLHCPLTPATKHLVGRDQFAQMKGTAVLVNTARGPVVDEAALVDALKNGQIAAAGLDVFEEEPKIHPGLLSLENVVLCPHLGSATHETRDTMSRLCAENIIAFADGKRPPTILNPEILKT